MNRKMTVWGLLSLGIVILTGCGNVTGPLSTLVNPPVQYGFDDGTTDGFAYSYSAGTSAVIPPNFFLIATTQASFQGSGSLEAQIPVTVGKDVDIGKLYSPTIDMTNKTVSAWCFWQSGGGVPPAQISAQIYVKDNQGYNFGSGQSVNLVQGQWTQTLFTIDTVASSVTITSIGELGIQINGPNYTPFTSTCIVGIDSVAF
jgi:hypothetical protein